MSRPAMFASMERIILVAAGVAVVMPVLALVVAAGAALWQLGWWTWLWWPLPTGCLVAWVLLRWRARRLAGRPDSDLHGDGGSAALYWTARDRAAWSLVEARLAKVSETSPQALTQPDVYANTAREMALEIARHYHPDTPDPLAALTVPEVLAAARLVMRDLDKTVADYLPAGHLLTIARWRQLSVLPAWYGWATKAYLAGLAVINPLQAVARYAASRVGMAPLTDTVKTNLATWLYVLYVQRLGRYLIELNSGRLRVGADRWLALQKAAEAGPGVSHNPASAMPTPAATPAPSGDAAVAAPPVDRSLHADPARDLADAGPGAVTILFVGQVKAGKSSVINALLGGRQAQVSALPATRAITAYRSDAPDGRGEVRLLDSPGYHHDGPAADDLTAVCDTACQAALVVLVMDAANPGRSPDVALLDRVAQWFAARPDRLAPPVLGVLTHVDNLSPMREWSPPYDDWCQTPPPQTIRPKSASIRDAVEWTAQELGGRVTAVVPVCVVAPEETNPPRAMWGVKPALLAAMVAHLPAGRAKLFLDATVRETDHDHYRRLWEQLSNIAGLAGASVRGGVGGSPPGAADL